jgi:hypothetical protein
VATLIVYSIMCAVYGGILTIVLLPPLYRRYQRWSIARAVRHILNMEEKSQV